MKLWVIYDGLHNAQTIGATVDEAWHALNWNKAPRTNRRRYKFYGYYSKRVDCPGHV
jgi:hypothetical protein